MRRQVAASMSTRSTRATHQLFIWARAQHALLEGFWHFLHQIQEFPCGAQQRNNAGRTWPGKVLAGVALFLPAVSLPSCTPAPPQTIHCTAAPRYTLPLTLLHSSSAPDHPLHCSTQTTPAPHLQGTPVPSPGSPVQSPQACTLTGSRPPGNHLLSHTLLLMAQAPGSPPCSETQGCLAPSHMNLGWLQGVTEIQQGLIRTEKPPWQHEAQP